MPRPPQLLARGYSGVQNVCLACDRPHSHVPGPREQLPHSVGGHSALGGILDFSWVSITTIISQLSFLLLPCIFQQPSLYPIPWDHLRQTPSKHKHAGRHRFEVLIHVFSNNYKKHKTEIKNACLGNTKVTQLALNGPSSHFGTKKVNTTGLWPEPNKCHLS